MVSSLTCLWGVGAVLWRGGTGGLIAGGGLLAITIAHGLFLCL